MNKNDVRTVACDFLVLGSAALLTALGALTAVGAVLAAVV
jgi:hypothetical protein